MIIDFHTHVFPDKIAAKTIRMLAEKADIPAHTDGSRQEAETSMERAGIDCSLVLPIATRPEQATSINRFAAELDRSPHFRSFGSLHPNDPSWRQVMESIRDYGLTGIKLHPDYQDFYIDDPRCFPIYNYAAELNLTISFHGGLDLGFPDCSHHTPKRMRTVLEHCPNTRFVSAHMGGYAMWDEVETYLVGTPVYLDTSVSIGVMPDEQAVRIIRTHGADKILFATDCPWDDQKEAVRRMQALPLTDAEKDCIFWQNACRLLGDERMSSSCN